MGWLFKKTPEPAPTPRTSSRPLKFRVRSTGDGTLPPIATGLTKRQAKRMCSDRAKSGYDPRHPLGWHTEGYR